LNSKEAGEKKRKELTFRSSKNKRKREEKKRREKKKGKEMA